MERLNLIGNRHSKASKFLVSLDETMDAVAAQLNATSKEVRFAFFCLFFSISLQIGCHSGLFHQ